MSQTIGCPACGFAVPVTADLAGMTVECAKCGVQFEVPEKLPAPGLLAPGAKPAPPRPPAPASAARPAPAPASPKPSRTACAAPAPVWDLPDANAPEPPALAGVQPASSAKLRILMWVGIAAAVLIVSLIAARWMKKPRQVGEPPPEMAAINRDVELDRWRFRVLGCEWKNESDPASRALDVRVRVTNLDAAERVVPVMCLGDRKGRSLAAEFGQPNLKADDGTGVVRLAAGASAEGHLIFQPPMVELCLIVAGDAGLDKGPSALIALTVAP